MEGRDMPKGKVFAIFRILRNMPVNKSIFPVIPGLINSLP